MNLEKLKAVTSSIKKLNTYRQNLKATLSVKTEQYS